MARELLKAQQVENAKPGMTYKGEKKPLDRDFTLSDGAGLFLRVWPSGKKQWVLVHSAKTGRRFKLVLGEYPDHSLNDARRWAEAERAKIDNGEDPDTLAERKRREQQEKKDRTLDALLRGYVATLVKRGKTSFREVENCLALHVTAELRQKAASDITKDDLVAPIRRLIEAGKVRTAGKLRSYLRAAFALALTAPDNPNAPAVMLGFKLHSNPVDRIMAVEGNTKTGERSLTRAELAEYQRRVYAIPRAEDLRDMLTLSLLLGGQRFRQLAQARLERDEEGTPIIVMLDPKGRRSEPRRHVLPLQGDALALVEARGNRLFGMDASEAEDFVKRVSSKVSRISAAMLADGACDSSFRAGDLRRTAETHLAARGVSRDLRAQLLSHGLSSVQDRNYDRHSYLPEKRAILQAWEAYLAEIPNSNVVALKSA